MSDKTKIIIIWVSVVFISTLFGALFVFMNVSADRQEKRQKAAMAERLAVDVGREEKTEMIRLEKDLVATNQAGEEVRLSDLKDKVWVAAQFFAECPNCATRNGDHLVQLYRKYKDHPDFHMVCISIDPERDDVERLQQYADNLGADTSNWWFLRGPREELHRYMEDEMKFLAVRERTKQEDIDREGRWAHDMGVAVFGKGMVMMEKKDLLFARQEGEGDELYNFFEGLLTSAIEKSLAKQTAE